MESRSEIFQGTLDLMALGTDDGAGSFHGDSVARRTWLRIFGTIDRLVRLGEAR